MVPGESPQMVPQGICASLPDEPLALCIIRDLTNMVQTTSPVVMNLPSSTTGVQLMEEVGRRFNYFADSFELILQRMPDKEQIPINELLDQTLEDLGFRCGTECRNNLILCEKNGVPPRRIDSTDVQCAFMDVVSDGAREEQVDTSATHVPPPAPPPYTAGSSDYSYNYIYTQGVTKQDTGFVGLVNQAMTCYLNSLLQTLYMTPEFRNAVYKWEFEGTAEEKVKSIPFQLQKLFLQLQTSSKTAVATTELTTSFGWDSSEAWQQHDVQELCRVMFDALEQTFKNTDQYDLISKNYEGKLKDYVRCLECRYESAREVKFLDIALVVRPFGKCEAYGSVEAALSAFVLPEILCGSNQYFCEPCKKKCNAHKGFEFVRFPYLLTLQLKRFDFDPLTMHRVKLNDRVSFPEILDLNLMMKLDRFDDTCDDGDTTDSGSALDDDSMFYSLGPKIGSSLSPETISDNSDLVDDDEGIDVGNLIHNQHSSEHTRVKNGPNLYELFSIMVHSGTSSGGHYYAYIKSFKDGNWYCFNDTQVTKITSADIEKTYGGSTSRGYYSSTYSSSTNAYMLMYRQIDPDRNVDFMDPQDFPDHIKILLEDMRKRDEQERQQKELDRNMCKIKLFGPHPTHKRLVEYLLKMHKDSTLREATATAQLLLGYENVPLDCCRLVKYDDFHDSLESSFENADDTPIGELFEGVKSTYKFDLLLEVKLPDEEFDVYKPGGTTVKVYTVDLERSEVSPFCSTVRSNLCDTVEAFKNKIVKTLGIQSGILRVALEVYHNIKLLDNPNASLGSEGFARSNKVFIEYHDVCDSEKPFEISKFYKILDQHAHTICMKVSLPKVDEGILERLKIHDNAFENSRDDSSSDGETNEDAMMATVPDARYSEKVSEDVTATQLYESDSKKIKVTTDPPCYESIKVTHSSYNTDILKQNKISITPDDPSQDCDEGLGDSEGGGDCFSTGYPSSHTVHSDQSEDSSLTDSERTLVRDELSPRNNSPDIMGSEIDQDFESPHHASSDVLKSDCDNVQQIDNMSCLLNDSSEDNRTLSSPEEQIKVSKFSSHVKQHLDDSSLPVGQLVEFPPAEETEKRYFRAWPCTDVETGEKMLRVYLDKRITLGSVKKELEPFIGVGCDYFKIYKMYTNNQEFECTRLNENLMSFSEDTKLIVRLGRALRKGEYKVKIYQLCVNESEPCKFLIDWVFVKGMTVLETKNEIIPEIKERIGLDVPLSRCRLRKKNWKNPGTIYLDEQQFSKDIPIAANWEVLLEILPEPEKVLHPWQISIFARRWHPDLYEIDPFQEIILDISTVESLKSKLSEVSGIKETDMEFARGQGPFPCETSVLSIHQDLDWYTHCSTLNTWPLSINDDGCVLYYKNKRTELKRLTEEEKRAIINMESAKSTKSRKTTASPRKERALKIYTVESSQSSPNPNNVQSNLSLAVD